MLPIYLAAINDNDDKNYFEQLYLKYRQDMYGISYSILHNKEDSEDAVHQAFLQIADNFAKIRSIPCQEIRAFFVIIIRNVSLNIYNKNKKRSERNLETEENDTNIEIDFFEKYEYEKLVKTISQLPQIYKDIIFLRYLEEFSVKEVARMLDISQNTVWKRTERAKKMLKELLEKEESYAE